MIVYMTVCNLPSNDLLSFIFIFSRLGTANNKKNKKKTKGHVSQSV